MELFYSNPPQSTQFKNNRTRPKRIQKLQVTCTSGFQRIKKLLPHADYPIGHGLQFQSPFMEHFATQSERKNQKQELGTAHYSLGSHMGIATNQIYNTKNITCP
jgi:hypothetical protein